MNKKYYVGVGSRNTPAEVLVEMQSLAFMLAKDGYTLLSGGANGADKAFETGCDKAGGEKLIFGRQSWNGVVTSVTGRPKRFNNLRYSKSNLACAIKIASEAHPAWDRLTPFVRTLMARNSFCVYGGALKTKPDFLICWTKDGAVGRTSVRTGGTGQALRLAKKRNIKIYNMQSSPDVGHKLGLY